MSQVYRLIPGAFTNQYRRLLPRSVLLMVVALGIGYAISARNSGPMSFTALLIFLAVALGAAGYGMYRGFRRAKAAWLSYELTLSEDAVRRTTSDIPAIVLPAAAIRSITEDPQGNVAIRGPSANQTIFVPAGVENREELLTVLRAWRPVDRTSPRIPWAARNVLAGLVSIALFATTFMATDPRIVVPAGLITGVGLLWCVWYLRQSRHVDRKLRGTIWFTLIPALAALWTVYRALRP